MTSHLRFYLGIAEYLASSTTSTFVTPNNAAFAKLLSSTTPGSPGASSAANDTSAIEALFPYHTLLCVHNASALSGKAQIISTALADPAYSNLGTALYDLGRLDEAYAAYLEALRLRSIGVGREDDAPKGSFYPCGLIPALKRESAGVLGNLLMTMHYDARFQTRD